MKGIITKFDSLISFGGIFYDGGGPREAGQEKKVKKVWKASGDRLRFMSLVRPST